MLAMRFYASLSWLFAMFFWPLLLFQAYRLRQSRPPRAYSWVHDSGSTPAKFSDMLSVTVIGGASVASDEIKDPQAALALSSLRICTSIAAKAFTGRALAVNNSASER
jgi:hypothetical protein